jgi:hypothetical protein
MHFRRVLSSSIVLALAACTQAPPANDAAPANDAFQSVDAPVVDLGPDDANTGLPDLTVDAATLAQNAQYTRQYFPPGSCEIAEGCVAAPGWRTLLTFTTLTPNVGTADLVLGPNTWPDGGINPEFEYSTCHMHYHFRNYADYTLLNPDGSTAAHGHKQSFCVEDLVQENTSDPTVRTTAFYGGCGGGGMQQGISRGWADDYYPNLPCQWIDVTTVPPGNYMLHVELNGMHSIPELDYSNNTATVPISIPSDFTVGDPTRDCVQGVGPDQGAGRNCGWRREGVHTCTPGTTISAGCNAGCGVGSCDDSQGSYNIRICDGDHNCNSADAALLLASDFGECGTGVFNLNSDCGVARFACPTSGMYTVLVATDQACFADADCMNTCSHGWCVDSSTMAAPFAGCNMAIVTGSGGDGGTSGDAGTSSDAGSTMDGGVSLDTGLSLDAGIGPG